MTLDSLPVRPLGSQGLRVSAQGLGPTHTSCSVHAHPTPSSQPVSGRWAAAGCAGMSFAYLSNDGPPTEAGNVAVIHRALELGVTMLDTAESYGPHINELLVGKAVRSAGRQCVIATKFGAVRTPQGHEVRGRPGDVRAAVEGSLQRLGVDTIDLYYQHRVDRTITIEETWRELKKLVEEGKVRYLGISEASAEEIRRAHAVHPITAVQLEWSLWTRNVEEEIVPLCRELGIGIVAYSPLGRGLLTGAIHSAADIPEGDVRHALFPRFQGEALKANLAMVGKVREVAARRGVTPGQLALAWVHAQGDDVFPIPGTKKLKYLVQCPHRPVNKEENLAAAHIQLTAEEKAELEAIFDPRKVQGERFTPRYGQHAFENAGEPLQQARPQPVQ